MSEKRVRDGILVELVSIIEGLSDFGTLLVFQAKKTKKVNKLLMQIPFAYAQKVVSELGQSGVSQNYTEELSRRLINDAGGRIEFLKLEIQPFSPVSFMGRLYVSFPGNIYRKMFSYEIELGEGLILALKSLCPIYFSKKLHVFLEQKMRDEHPEVQEPADESDFSVILDEIDIGGTNRYKM